MMANWNPFARFAVSEAAVPAPSVSIRHEDRGLPSCGLVCELSHSSAGQVVTPIARIASAKDKPTGPTSYLMFDHAR